MLAKSMHTRPRRLTISMTRRRYRFAARLPRGQARVLIGATQVVAIKFCYCRYRVDLRTHTALSLIWQRIKWQIAGLIRLLPLRSNGLVLSFGLAVDILLLPRKDLLVD